MNGFVSGANTSRVISEHERKTVARPMRAYNTANVRDATKSSQKSHTVQNHEKNRAEHWDIVHGRKNYTDNFCMIRYDVSKEARQIHKISRP